jgi:hypothetical protein
MVFSQSKQSPVKLREGKDVKGRVNVWLLLGVLAAMVLASGCALLEMKDSGGRVERLEIDSGEGWSSYDTRPRDPYANTGKHGMDDMSIMLKSVKTF